MQNGMLHSKTRACLRDGTTLKEAGSKEQPCPLGRAVFCLDGAKLRQSVCTNTGLQVAALSLAGQGSGIPEVLMRLPGLNKSADRLWIMTAGCSLLEGEVQVRKGQATRNAVMLGWNQRCQCELVFNIKENG